MHLHLANMSVCGCLAYQSTVLMEPSSTSISLPLTPRATGRTVVAAGAGCVSIVEAVAAYQLAAGAGSAVTPQADGGVPRPEHLCPEHLCHV